MSFPLIFCSSEKQPLAGNPYDERGVPLGGSDKDSLEEYGDVDPTKFNEDGSFIGQYGNQQPTTPSESHAPSSVMHDLIWCVYIYITQYHVLLSLFISLTCIVTALFHWSGSGHLYALFELDVMLVFSVDSSLLQGGYKVISARPRHEFYNFELWIQREWCWNRDVNFREGYHVYNDLLETSLIHPHVYMPSLNDICMPLIVF